MKKILSFIASAVLVLGCNAQDKGFKSLSVEDYEKAISDTTIVRLDVRSEKEFLEGHIKNALNIDVMQPDFEQKAISSLSKTKTIAVNCRSGKRSKKAADILAKNGYKVIELDEGFNAWVGAGKETSTSTQQTTSAEPDATGYIIRVGQQVPDITWTQTDGKTVNIKDLRGKVVMLQFTASWCGVCRKEMPFIERDIWQKHKSNPDFYLVGIDRDEPLEKVREFAQKTGVTYPLALDPGADIFAKFALRESGITRNVLIDRDGTIVMTTRLYKEDEFNRLVEKIDSMLK